MPSLPLRSCSRGHFDKPVSGVCPTCLRVACEEHDEAPEVAYILEPSVDATGDVFPAGEWE